MVAQSDVDLPPGADQRVHIYFTQGSCMTITPVAVPQTVMVKGDAVTASSTTQHTKVRGFVSGPRAFEAVRTSGACQHVRSRRSGVVVSVAVG